VKRRSNKAIILAAVATLALIGLDLWTKHWATENLSVEHPGTPPEVCAEPGRNQRLRGESVELVEGIMELSYAENCGAAFGLLNDSPSWIRRIVFGIAAVAAAVFLSMFFVRGKGGALFAWSVPLVVSGAVGNLADRARLGYVVDFIRVHYEHEVNLIFTTWDRFEYPTFNVADITITIGVVLLILDGIVEERKLKRAKNAEGDGAAEADSESGSEDEPRPKRKRKKKKKAKAKPRTDESSDDPEASAEASAS